VWGDTIVDGHNRFEICTANDIAFDAVRKSFADRQEVMDWIDKNQLGRRNMTPDQMSLIRGRMYNRMKLSLAEASSKGHSARYQNDTGQVSGLTRVALAQELGVGEATIGRDSQFATAVEILPEVKAKVRRGEKVVKKDVIAAAKAKQEGDDEKVAMLLGTDKPKAEVPVSDNLKDVFAQAKVFKDWDNRLKELDREIHHAMKNNPAACLIYPKFYQQAMDKLRSFLRDAKPVAVCDDCGGTGVACDSCRGTGFLSKYDAKLLGKDSTNGEV
jgi:hypothetical protein